MRPDTDALDLTVNPCEDCAPTTRWERRDLSPTREVWLGTCDTCGSMRAFVPGEPDLEVEDPLSFFLLGNTTPTPTPERPAWQRFYTLTTGAPYFLRWDFQPAPCGSCQATTTVATDIRSPAWRRSLSLCLNCGTATVETSHHMPDATPTHLTGKQWAPPDPAVKTLRETVIQTYRRWVAYQAWKRRKAGDDPDP